MTIPTFRSGGPFPRAHTLALLLFVLNYSKTSVIRHELYGSQIHSTVERNVEDERYLRDHGHRLYLLKLRGYLFFGTATHLSRRVREQVERPSDDPIHFVIVDFAQVTGIDMGEAPLAAVAVAVASGAADAGLGVLSAARALELDFTPVTSELYELIIPEVFFETGPIERLLEVIEHGRRAVGGVEGSGAEAETEQIRNEQLIVRGQQGGQPPELQMRAIETMQRQQRRPLADHRHRPRAAF